MKPTTKNPEEFTVSPYLKGRIRTVAKLDGLTSQQVFTAALITYLDGDTAAAKYYDKIDAAKPAPPWQPFMAAPEGETEDERKVRVEKALRARFPTTETPPTWEAIGFLKLIQ